MPQLKAKKLFDKFYKIFEETDTCFGICENETKKGTCTGTGHGCYLWKLKAKECALITIQEIIDSNPVSPYTGGWYYETLEDRINYVIEYYKQVKIEIELL